MICIPLSNMIPTETMIALRKLCVGNCMRKNREGKKNANTYVHTKLYILHDKQNATLSN